MYQAVPVRVAGGLTAGQALRIPDTVGHEKDRRVESHKLAGARRDGQVESTRPTFRASS